MVLASMLGVIDRLPHQPADIFGNSRKSSLDETIHSTGFDASIRGHYSSTAISKATWPRLDHRRATAGARSRCLSERLPARPQSLLSMPAGMMHQNSSEALILVATSGGPTMFARIGIMRALNRQGR